MKKWHEDASLIPAVLLKGFFHLTTFYYIRDLRRNDDDFMQNCLNKRNSRKKFRLVAPEMGGNVRKRAIQRWKGV